MLKTFVINYVPLDSIHKVAATSKVAAIELVKQNLIAEGHLNQTNDIRLQCLVSEVVPKVGDTFTSATERALVAVGY